MGKLFQCCLLSLIVYISLGDSLTISTKNENTEQKDDLGLKTHLDLFKREVDELKSKMDVSYNYLVFLYRLNSVTDTNQFVPSMEKLVEKKEIDNDISMEIQESRHNSSIDEILFVEEKSQADKRYFDEHLNCLKNCTSSNESCPDNNYKDTLYILKLPNLSPFYAFCFYDTTNKKSWTIIQRREDGSEDFNRDWLDYKLGFGNVYGEYWIGLERLHVMTKTRPYTLYILLEDYEQEKRYALYSKFSIESESEGYKLYVDGYSGNAGDSFSDHNNMKFSTFDQDNDNDKRNCARDYKSGWWYKSCYYCNLNGVYASYSNQNIGVGVKWNHWHGKKSLKYAHMAIRPV